MNLHELRLKEISLLKNLLQKEDELLMMYEGLLGPENEEDNEKRNPTWCVNELARLTAKMKKTSEENRRVNGLKIILAELEKRKSQNAS
jgi:hypothetical protein